MYTIQHRMITGGNINITEVLATIDNTTALIKSVATFANVTSHLTDKDIKQLQRFASNRGIAKAITGVLTMTKEIAKQTKELALNPVETKDVKNITNSFKNLATLMKSQKEIFASIDIKHLGALKMFMIKRTIFKMTKLMKDICEDKRFDMNPSEMRKLQRMTTAARMFSRYVQSLIAPMKQLSLVALLIVPAMVGVLLLPAFIGMMYLTMRLMGKMIRVMGAMFDRRAMRMLNQFARFTLRMVLTYTFALTAFILIGAVLMSGQFVAALVGITAFLVFLFTMCGALWFIAKVGGMGVKAFGKFMLLFMLSWYLMLAGIVLIGKIIHMDEFGVGLFGMLVSMAALIGVCWLMGKVANKENTQNVADFGKFSILFVAASILLVIGIWTAGKLMQSDTFWEGALGMGVAMAALLGVCVLVSLITKITKEKDAMQFAIVSAVIVLSTLALVGTIALIAKLVNEGGFWEAFAGMTAIMGVLMLFATIATVLGAIASEVMLGVVVIGALCLMIATSVLLMTIALKNIKEVFTGETNWIHNFAIGMFEILTTIALLAPAAIIASIGIAAMFPVALGVLLWTKTFNSVNEQFAGDPGAAQTLKNILGIKLAIFGVVNTFASFGLGDAIKLAKAMIVMPQLAIVSMELSFMALMLGNIARLQIPSKWDAKGHPIEYERLDANVFKDVMDSINNIIGGVVNAVTATNNYNLSIFGVARAMIILSLLNSVCIPLAGMALVISNLAMLKVAIKWDKDGNPVDWRQMKPKDFEDARTSAKTIASMMVEIMLDPDLQKLGADFEQSIKTGIVARMMFGAGDLLGRCAESISQLAQMHYISGYKSDGTPIYKPFADGTMEQAKSNAKSIMRIFVELFKEMGNDSEFTSLASKDVDVFTQNVEAGLFGASSKYEKQTAHLQGTAEKVGGIMQQFGSVMQMLTGIVELLQKLGGGYIQGVDANGKKVMLNITKYVNDDGTLAAEGVAIAKRLVGLIMIPAEIVKSISKMDFKTLLGRDVSVGEMLTQSDPLKDTKELLNGFNEVTKLINDFAGSIDSLYNIKWNKYIETGRNTKGIAYTDSFSNMIKGIQAIMGVPAIIATATTYSGVNESDILTSQTLIDHTSDFLQTIDKVKVANLNTTAKMIADMRAITDKVGSMDKLAEAIANKLSVAIEELEKELKKIQEEGIKIESSSPSRNTGSETSGVVNNNKPSKPDKPVDDKKLTDIEKITKRIDKIQETLNALKDETYKVQLTDSLKFKYNGDILQRTW